MGLVDEGAVSLVDIHHILDAPVGAGSAVAGVARVIARADILRCLVDEVCDVEIEEAVGIEISKKGSRPPCGIVSAGGCREVGEGTITVVMQQQVGAVVGDIDVRKAISIVIANSHALSIATVSDTSFFGDVVELDRTILSGTQTAKQLVWCVTGQALLRLQLPAVGEEQIEPSVQVGIQPGHTATHHFGNHPTPLDHVAVIHKLNPRLCSDILEHRLHRHTLGRGCRWRRFLTL